MRPCLLLFIFLLSCTIGFTQQPTISSFTPTAGFEGGTLTITGTNFTGATAVYIGATAAASFTVLSSTTLTAVIGAGSVGPIGVITPGGTAMLGLFIYMLSRPTIVSFTPLSATAGQTVVVTGTHLTQTTAVSFGGLSAASFSALSSTTLTAVVPLGTTGDLSITTIGGTVAFSGFTYIPPSPPTITSFTPTSGGTGTAVTITGTNLFGTTALSFGGTAAASFTVFSSTSVQAIIASGTTGDLAVTAAGGSTAFSGFTFVPLPVIASFTPASAITGTTITITGTNLSGATAVSFGGTAAASFTVLSSTSVTAVVGAGASGSINITTAGGTGARSGFGYIPPPPTLTSFSPTSAATGATVSITGTNFTGATAVSFGGTAATSFSVVSSTSLIAVVASGASGSINITTAGGTVGLSGFTYILSPPTITSFTPLSAVPGASVTITGSNFNTTTTNNIVFFGATRATITAATTSSLTVTVPAGATYGPVTVLNATTYLSVASSASFIPVFSIGTSSGIAASDFAAKKDTSTAGVNPTNILTGDLDGDGKPDLVIINSDNSNIALFLNTSTTSTISFASPVIISSATNPFAGALGDLDGDGKLDLAVTELNSNNINILLNKSTVGVLNMGPASYGSGPFTGNIFVASGSRPIGVNIADIDNDGRPDLVVSNTNSNTASIFRNTGSSGGQLSFAASVDLVTGTSVGPFLMQVGDLDGDGKPDLAIGEQGTNTSIAVFRNTSTAGAISFAARADIAVGSAPWGLVMGDLDGDGKPDLAVASYTSNTISFFRNISFIGTIAFAAKTDIATANPSYTFAITDLDGDGKPDLAVPNYTSSSLSIFRNTSSPGTITFATSFSLTANNSPANVTAADFNGDGKPDLAVASRPPSGNNTFSIYMNQVKVPKLTAFTPASAAQNDTVLIRGSNLTGTTIVSFGGTAALSFTIKNDTLLAAKVGAGSTGSISVTTPGGTAALTGFTFLPPPTVASFTPLSGTTGTVIRVTGTNFAGVSAVSIGGTAAVSFTVLSSTTLTAIVGSGATGSVSITTTGGTAGLSGFTYIVTAAPTISSFTPLSATTGTNVIITGTNLSSIMAVSFGGTAAASFTVFSSTSLTAVVASGSTGSVSITTAGGTVSLSGFTYVLSPPTVASFTPLSATTGATITVTGSNFADVTAVSIGGTAAVTFTVLSSTTLTAVVGSGSSGFINITTAGGTSGLSGFTYFAAPVITSFTPLSATTGATVIIAGSNFNTTAANNIVFFGATRATVTNASSGGITVTVPSGATYAPITVLNADLYLSGASAASFVPVFSPKGSGIAATDFAARKDTSSGGTNPTNVLTGDLDGDGKPDLIIINSDNSNIAFFLNTSTTGAISFAKPVIVSSGTNPFAGALGDLDGDGKLDLAVTELGSSNINILLNKSTVGVLNIGPSSYGSGQLKGNISVTVGNRPIGVSIADIDGDGRPDMVVTNTNSNTVSVLRNAGTTPGGQLSFYPSVDLVTGTTVGPFSVQVGDIDGDGKPDLAIAYQFTNTYISVYRNTSTIGNINFGSKIEIQAGSTPWGLLMGDIDGDGKPDLTVASYTSNTVSVFRNTSSTGSISFAPKTDLAVTNPSYTFSIADLDGDGKPDLVLTNYTSSSLSILRNTSTAGTISFAPNVILASGNSPGSVVAADLNGDGRPDLVVTNRPPLGDNTFSIFMNRASVPKLLSFSPASGVQNDTISIKGRNLTGTSAVSFGGVNAVSFIVLNDTTINAILGSGSSGYVTIKKSSGADSAAGFTYGAPELFLTVPGRSSMVFGSFFGAYSTLQDFSISGKRLIGNVTITLAGAHSTTSLLKFTISPNTTDSSFSGTYTIAPKNNGLDSTKINVRYRANIVGTFIDTILISSPKAVTRMIQVSGSSCDSTILLTPLINNFTKDTTVCIKDSIVLKPIINYNFYRWSTTDTSRSITIKASDAFTLQVAITPGCYSLSSAVLKVIKNLNPVPVLALAGETTLVSSNAANYRWYYNNSLVAGNTSNTLVANKIGFYAVETSLDKVCWNLSNDFPIVFISAPLVNDSISIKAYPNPSTSGTFNIVATLQRPTNVVAKVTVTDVNGVVLLQTNKFIFFGREIKIPITLTAKGTVFAKLDVNGDIKTVTVILQ